MYKTRIIYSQRHSSGMSDEAIRRLLMDIFDIKDDKPKAEPQRMTEDLAAKLTVADSKFRNISGQVDTVCEMDDEEYNPDDKIRGGDRCGQPVFAGLCHCQSDDG